MTDWTPPDSPVAWAPPDAPIKEPAALGPAKEPAKPAPLVGQNLPIPDPIKDVLPPLANFAMYPPRALAATLYSSVDVAKQKLEGHSPTAARWWEAYGKSLEATKIPETGIGRGIEAVLDVPGEVVGGVVKAASTLALGKETTEGLAIPATIAMNVGAPLLAGRAVRGAGAAPARVAAPDIGMQAADIVAGRLAQDVKYGGPTATDAIAKIGAARSAGKPLTIADVGEENVKALGGYVARQPGESRALARSFLEARDKAASERLAQDVGQYVFSGPTMMQTTDDLLKTRSAAARPLYQQAEALQGVWSPRLQEFIAEPEIRKGLARGFKLERLESLAEGRPFNPNQLGVDLDFEGNIVMKSVPNLRVLDMGKRGLDAMIADERDPLTGRLSAMGRSLDMVRNAYVSEIDALDTSGSYRAAREAWAGPSQSLDAMRWGRSVFNRSPEETAAAFQKLSPNNQEFVRLGVADTLRERIAKTGFSGDESRAVVKNAWTQDQLRPIFRSEAEFDKFVDAVMSEKTMAQTASKTLGGSPTATRLAEDKGGLTPEVGSSAAHMASAVIHGNFPLALIHGWRIQRRLRKDVGEDPALNEAVAKIIFNPAIDLADPQAQRMISGPPPNTRGASVGHLAKQLGIYGAPASQMGLTDHSSSLP